MKLMTASNVNVDLKIQESCDVVIFNYKRSTTIDLNQDIFLPGGNWK